MARKRDDEPTITVSSKDGVIGREVDGRWQPYNGSCGCERCRTKSRRDGYWKAPKADYAVAKGEDFSRWYVK